MQSNMVKLNCQLTKPWFGLVKLLLLGNASKKTLLICVLFGFPSVLLMLGAAQLGLDDKYIFLGYGITVIVSVVWVLFVAAKSASIIVNSQFYLVNLRSHLFLTLLSFNGVLAFYLTGPVNMFGQSIVWAKLIAFIYFSSATLWIIWLRCLALLSFIISVLIIGAVFLLVSFEICTRLQAALLFCVLVWGYFFYWLHSSGLQRSFKYQNFSGPVDFIIERLKFKKFRYLTQVMRNPNIVILSGMSDGLINRYVLSGFFGLVFVFSYLVFIKIFSYGLTFAWAIGMILTTRAKFFADLCVRKRNLWVLLNGGRQDLFNVIEDQLIKDTFVTFLMIFLLVLWRFNAEKIPIDIQLSRFFVCAISFVVALYLDISITAKMPTKYRLAKVIAGLSLMMVMPFVMMLGGLSFVTVMVVASVMLLALIVSRRYAKSRLLNGEI